MKIQVQKKMMLTLKTVRVQMYLFIITMLTIYSLNANGLRNVDKMKNIFITCEVFKWDILCLQETFWSDDFITEVRKHWDGKLFYNNYEFSHRKGVAILVRKDLNIKHIDVLHGDKGRLLKLTFEQYEKIINVFSLYAPNEFSERKMFFERCKRHINSDEINIIGGDFNDYPDTHLDRSKSMTVNSPNNSSFCSFIRDNSLVDIWRDRNPDKRTYSRKMLVQGVYKMSRIDAFIISRTCMQYTTHCFYKSSSMSDHSYVCIKCDFNEVDRGPGMWVFNNTLLHDEYFTNRIRDMVNSYLQCPLYTREKIVWWDNLKHKLKSYAKYYSQKKYRDQQNEFWNLHNNLQKEYSKIDRGIITNHERVIELESDLKKYEKQKCDGAILRSKATWAIESDRNTSYFLKLEKYKQENNSVKELYTADGNIVSNTTDILDTEVEFYQNLYTSEQASSENQSILFKLIKRKISEDHKEKCDEIITKQQLTNSLNSMTKNKSPGFDGLTVEFYQHFWDILGSLLTEVVHEIKQSKELTPTMKRGVISLIYKKKGDKKLLKNWRPITLLNVDYKIISKTLASRLKLVLDDVISPEQTCSVPGRDISENIAAVRDIIDYSLSENIHAYILKIDSEKAFDRVSHDYLFKLLPHFGLGENFIEWIKILYTDISSAIKCNGHISKFFNVHRSVRQGCCMSALLYILAAEPLNLLLKNSTLRGIDIKGTKMTSLIYQHADDTTLTLAEEKSVLKCFEVLDIYCKATGAKVNVEKSEVLVINASINTLSSLNLPLLIKDDFVEILGVALGGDKKTCEHINWRKKIDKIQNVLNLWKQRHLTLRGKAVVIQTLLLSRVWYVLNVMPLPDWVERELKKCCSSFLWDNKPPQIKYSSIIAKEDNGGLNIPDIKTKRDAFRLKWLKKYFDEDVNATWKQTMNYFLYTYSNLGLTFEIFSVIHNKTSLNDIPLYYRELLEAWHLINMGKRYSPSMLEDIYHQPLFSNPHITKCDRMLYFRIFIKCKITKIEHIVKTVDSGFVSEDELYQTFTTSCTHYDKEKIKKLYKHILDALPQHWTNLIEKRRCPSSSMCIPNIECTDNIVISASCFSSKLCYGILLSNVSQQPTSTTFIESFGLSPNTSFWKTIFSKFKNPDMFNLDFKIAHGIVWTREKLFRVKISDTNRCPICTTEIEDLLHMFIECDYLEEFHRFIIDVLTYFYKDKGFDENELHKFILFGVTKRQPFSDFLNLFLSCARIAIYKRRCLASLKDKVIDVKYYFETNFKDSLNNLYFHSKKLQNNTFEAKFLHNIPYIRMEQEQISIKW